MRHHRYSNHPPYLKFASLGIKLCTSAVVAVLLSGSLIVLQVCSSSSWIAKFISAKAWRAFRGAGWGIMICGIVLLVLAAFSPMQPKNMYITQLIKRALFDPSRGNPLRLKEGQYLPTVRCSRCGSEQGQFLLRITTEGFTPEQIKNLGSVISTALTGKVRDYAVTRVRETMSRNYVEFAIEDMTIDHRLVFLSAEEMLFQPITKLLVDKRTTIDLKTSGSIICAGKTRSGKTTGIISQLLQVIPYGPDQYWSECLIVDPKRAELSRLPYTVTVDEDGGGRAILTAVKRFADSIPKRQDVLNGLSEVDGNAVHWWEVGMRPSFLFLDEFVSLRSC